MLNGEWRKATKSGGNSDMCVEVRYVDGSIQVRDSKDQSGPVLNFSPGEWEAFQDGMAEGEFNLPA